MIGIHAARIFGICMSPFLVAACTPARPPPSGEGCVAACETLERLGCPEGAATPAGAPCPVWLCASGYDSGALSCLARAASCESARGCP